MRLSVRWTIALSRFLVNITITTGRNDVSPLGILLRSGIRLKRIVYTTAPPPPRGCLVNVGRACECARAGRGALFGPRAATKIRLKATLNKLRQWAKLRGSVRRAAQMFSDYCALTRRPRVDRVGSCGVASSLYCPAQIRPFHHPLIVLADLINCLM